MINEGQNLIIVMPESGGIEVWGSLTDVCKNHPEYSYYTMRNKKFPFTYKKAYFYKVKYKEVNF